MRILYFLQLVILVLIEQSEQFNILAVLPHFGKSHFLVFQPLFEKLAATGHNITVVSYFPRTAKIPNYHDVSLYDGKLITQLVFDVEQFDHSRIGKLTGVNQLLEYAEQSCPKGLSNENFQHFLQQDNNYDLLLIEIFNSNCFFGLAKQFDTPVIGLSTCAMLPWIPSLYGIEENPSYNPSVFMDLPEKMSFLDRLENTICYIYSSLVFKYIIAERGYEYSQKFVNKDMRQGLDPMYNMSLLLINTHYSLIRPRPVTPNFIEVGGIHMSSPKPLPQHIEKFINESADGVIYVSMGSMLKGHSFPTDKLNIFLRAFSWRPQRIIWKWENGTLESSAENIMTLKWAPQRDIICHPNVKLFISHGGLLGTLESVDCGIPVIAMPQYGDQFANAKALENAGGGIVFDLKSATEEGLNSVLSTVLSPKFRERVKTLSERFKDRPLPPMDTAIYWIEYVARHGGADFMRPASLGLRFFEYYLLDVAALIFIVLGTWAFISFYLFKICLRYFFESREIHFKEKAL